MQFPDSYSTGLLSDLEGFEERDDKDDDMGGDKNDDEDEDWRALAVPDRIMMPTNDTIGIML